MKNKGITLISILIIIAIIAGVGVLGYLGYQQWFGQKQLTAEDYTTEQSCKEANHYWYNDSCHNKKKIKVSTESFRKTSFPAADNQFPIPDYEKKFITMIDDFSGGSGEAEFFLAYAIAGVHREDVKNFYTKQLKKEDWQPKGEYGKVDISDREKPVRLIFTKPDKSDLYRAEIIISTRTDLQGDLEGWPEKNTVIRVRENWPTGFEHAKDLTPNSPFCRYFDKDFKKILEPAIGKVKLSGLHEWGGLNSEDSARMFYYGGENSSFASATKTEIFNKMEKVKESFKSNGYKVNWQRDEFVKPIEISKKVAGKKYSFHIMPLADGFTIQYPPMMTGGN